MKNIIILTQMCDFRQEAWGSITELSKAHGWSYNYLKRQKLPFEYKGWLIKRVPFKALAEFSN